jgi:hypothetical protein
VCLSCRIKALTTKFNDNPEEASRPFDNLRSGFVMADGAATLILEVNWIIWEAYKCYPILLYRDCGSRGGGF